MDKQLSGEIVKVDEEQGRVYGWAYTFTKNGEQVVDHSQDVIDTPEARASLEEAFVGYVKDHRTGDLDHEQFDVSQLIEAVFVDKSKAELMGGIELVSSPNVPPSIRRLMLGRSSMKRSNTSDGSAQSRPMTATFSI